MSETKLCEACKAFLQGDLVETEDWDGYYWHTRTAESLKIAEELPCDMCTQVRVAFARDPRHRMHGPSLASLSGTVVSALPEIKHVSHEPYKIVVFHGVRRDDSGSLELIEWGRLMFKPCTAPESNSTDALASWNTGDDQTLKYMKAKYDSCLAEHEHCAQPGAAEFLPTRLLDVGFTAEPALQLCDSTTIEGSARYAALSHCWGNVQPLTLTQDSSQMLYSGVSLDCLPLTFQHAAVVTRKLNLRYLWINSLCIYQDSIADWEKEAGCMRDVYRNSAVCIAATAASNSDEGLFFDRDRDQDRAFLVNAGSSNSSAEVAQVALLPSGTYWCSAHPVHSYKLIEEAPLNNRAWVAQERHLSSRILHFTQTALFWECLESFTHEMHPELSALCCVEAPSGRKLKRIIMRKSTRPLSDEHATVYEAWHMFRLSYTQCSMTKESDVLMALRGVELDTCEILSDRLIFGLWRNQLMHELNWRCYQEDRRDRPSIWRGPSWSWTSTMRVIDDLGHRMGFGVELAKVLKYPIETKDASDWQSYSIILQCRLMTLLVDRRQRPKERRSASLTLNNTITCSTDSAAQLLFDDIDQSLVFRQNTCRCQFLALFDECIKEWSEIRGLLIVPDSKFSGCYKRIGYLYLQSSSVAQINTFGGPSLNVALEVSKMHGTLQDQDITLI